jgi:hypothetical protein
MKIIYCTFRLKSDKHEVPVIPLRTSPFSKKYVINNCLIEILHKSNLVCVLSSFDFILFQNLITLLGLLIALW